MKRHLIPGEEGSFVLVEFQDAFGGVPSNANAQDLTLDEYTELKDNPDNYTFDSESGMVKEKLEDGQLGQDLQQVIAEKQSDQG